MLRRNTLLALALVAAFALLAGCADAASNNAATSHTFADAGTSMSVYSKGLQDAVMNTTGSGSAYVSYSTDYSVITYTFSNYSADGITINGTLTSTSSVISGTLNFTGGDVKQIQYNNITGTSGTLVIKFTDGSNWTYNYANQGFVQG